MSSGIGAFNISIMKKIICAIIFILVISAFAGCSKSEEPSQTSSKATKSVEETTEAETQTNTQKITTTDEFPTVADDES